MLNNATIMGRLTADPELKQTANRTSVTAFSIAVQRDFAPKDAERVTDFLDIVAWRQTAETVCKYFRKGHAIIIEGSIQTRKYVDKTGQERRVWEIVADRVHFVEKKFNSPAAPGQDDGQDINTDGDAVTALSAEGSAE